MTLQSDHKALIFVGAIAVLGAGVRVVRAASASSSAKAQPALEHQMQAADSSKRAVGGKRRPKKAAIDTGRIAAIAAAPSAVTARVNGRLDLDIATAAQVDSLPGVSTAMAKRIVADRMQHGPFLSLARLRRVSGVGPKLIQELDTLVSFSGTIVPPNPADTVVRTKRGRTKSAPMRPAALRTPAPPRAPSLRAGADSYSPARVRAG